MTWIYVVFCIDGSRPVFTSWSDAEKHPVEGPILAFRVSPAQRAQR